jgi:hypothetical protein
MHGYDLWGGNRRLGEIDGKDKEILETLMSRTVDYDLLSIPGIIDIPSCTWTEIISHWKRGPPPANEDPGTYPCNEKPR